MYFGRTNFRYIGWNNNKDQAEKIFSLFGKEFWLIVIDSEYISNEFYREKLEYYIDSYLPNNMLGSLAGGNIPRFEIEGKFKLSNYGKNEEYCTIIKVLDQDALEAVLTYVSGNESLHFFSDDFDLDTIICLFEKYYKYCYLKDVECIASFFKSEIERDFCGKKLVLLDTSWDDEDQDSFFYLSRNNLHDNK